MPRILLLVADEHLSAAVAMAVADCGSPRAASSADPATVEAAVRGAEWDVCVADTAFAATALAARRGRGLVVLGVDPPSNIAPGDRTQVPSSAHLLRIPCSVATLRDAVSSVAAASRASTAS